MNVFTIISPHNSLAMKKISEILKIHNIDQSAITYYDMQDDMVSEAIFDVSSIGFLDPKKAVVVKNPYFLTASTFKGPDHDLEKLTKHVDKFDSENILIFYCPYEKLDERKKIVKLLKKKSEYIKIGIPNEFDLLKIAQNELRFANVKAHDDVVRTLINMTKNSHDKLINELGKVRDYFFESTEKVLTFEIMTELVSVALEDNIFLLTEALAVKNIKTAHKIFTDLMVQKEEPIKLIVMIANQFRLFKQIQILQRQGLYEKDIATILSVHPYRVKIAAGQARRFQMAEIDGILKSLAEMDLNIKSGFVNSQDALELFILGMN